MRTAAVFGIEACTVQVEVDVSFGIPSFTMVGLPDISVRESRDRVRSAIRNSGFDFPPHRITVNLSPADIRKAGSLFDLPIALGVLAAAGLVARRDIADVLLLGELSLDGSIQTARGVLPIAAAARRERYRGLLLPRPNTMEAAVVAGLALYPVRSLTEAVAALNDPPGFLAAHGPQPEEAPRPASAPADGDFADVHGQALARRALEIAAAGGHNTLMIGSPGAGKTMMARRVGGILPPLTFDEALDATSIHSVAGLLAPGTRLLTTRPFRSPHHTISDVALVGGGQHPRPGEISLAHHGVLFLDEMPEFSRHVLEVLRQPIEEGCVRIARAARTVVFPARDESMPVRLPGRLEPVMPMRSPADCAIRGPSVGTAARSHRPHRFCRRALRAGAAGRGGWRTIGLYSRARGCGPRATDGARRPPECTAPGARFAGPCGARRRRAEAAREGADEAGAERARLRSCPPGGAHHRRPGGVAGHSLRARW
jgi:magnesium chelatase family protein